MMRLSKSSIVEVFGARLGAQNCCQFFWFIIVAALALVELLHIGQIERSKRARALPFATHVALKVIPIDLKLRRDDWIPSKDPSAFEIYPQALKYNHVGRDDQERFGKSSRASATALKNCHAITSDMTFVLPLPVAIFTT